MSRWPSRYAPWMARDLAGGAGLIMLAVVAIGTFILARSGVGTGSESAAGVLATIVSQAAVPFVLLATGGMVSADLRQGYYCTLFTKPVSPVAYYLQRWLLGAALVALFPLLMAAGIALTTHAFAFSWAMLGQVGLLYLLLGGLVFFLSTLTRRDWLLALLVYILQAVVHGLKSGGALFGWLGNTLDAVLPPFHLCDVRGPLPEGAALAHLLLYSGGLVGAALLLLWRRPMGSGGRS